MVALAVIVPILIILLILYLIGQRAKLRSVTSALAEAEIAKKELTEREVILAKELELQKIENLRFTLNPHSFKNTLNAIEELAEGTFKSVRSLSSLFDYMLYDAKSQFVPLHQEIHFAKEYLALYKLRLSPVIDVRFEIDPIIENNWAETKLIAPLIFAHFIENAFKHGDTRTHDGFIRIKLEPINENELVYSVRNKVGLVKSDKKGGLGNDSFVERLNLLYKEKHHLDYYKEGETFSANLKLNLYHE